MIQILLALLNLMRTCSLLRSLLNTSGVYGCKLQHIHHQREQLWHPCAEL